MRRIGLTGGIGSGKSTVSALWQALGATIVDTDAIARSLTVPGGPAMPALVQAFGTDIADATGALDRARMRERVFADAGAKRVLEINPQCELVAALTRRLKAKGNAEEIGEAAWLILDQARILQGETLEDPVAFARRQSEMMRRALGS